MRGRIRGRRGKVEKGEINRGVDREGRERKRQVGGDEGECYNVVLDLIW